MPDISTKATVGIELNTQPVGRKIAEQETKLDKLNEKKRQFESAGDQKGLVKIQKEINKVSRQLATARTASDRCKAALAKLNESSPKELRHTLKQLKDDLDHMVRGSAAWKAHVEAIKRVKAEIKSVDAELREHEGLLSRINRKVNEWGMSIASAVAGLTGLVFTARQAVEAYASMEQEMANVRKFTGMTADEVAHMNEEFMKIDTRTSREDLNKLAQEAGRLGLQSEEDVLGFVRAADKINVALDDLGEGATLTLSKLTDIFGDRERLGTEQSLLAVGSVINELSQNCTASAPYLADFAQRLAGVDKQANMTIPEIMGFAAVLDSQGQAVEMSATALSQLIMKLFQDPAKIAKATGMDLQAFNKVLKEDTNEALIMLLEHLNSIGNIDVLAPVFESMGTDGARASAVLAALAGNVEQVKNQQREANKAFQQATSIDKEFAVQNNTVQAGLDKAKIRFHELAVELGEKLAPAMKYAITGTSAMMRVLSGTISFISQNRIALGTLIGAIGMYTLVVKGATISSALYKTTVSAVKVAIAAWRATQLAVSGVIALFTGNITRATAAFKLFNATLRTNPIGLVFSAVAALMGGIIAIGESMKANREEAERLKREHEEWKQSITNIDQASNQYSANELARLKSLYNAATDETKARKERVAAAQRMQSLYPSVFANFSTEAIMAGKAMAAYEQLTASIIANAKARAAAEKIQENEKAILDLEADTRKRQQSNAKATQNLNRAKGQQAQQAQTNSGQHAFMPAAVRTHAEQQTSQAIRKNTEAITANNAAIRENNTKVTELKQANQDLASIPGVDKVLLAGGGTGTQPKVSYTPHGDSSFNPEEKRHQREAAAEEKKRQAEEEKQKRIAAALEKKEFKDSISALKSNLENQNAAALGAYNKGEIDYVTYLDKKQAAAKEYYEGAEKVYKKFDAEESADLAKMREKKAEEDKKYRDERLKLLQSQYANERDLAKIAASMEFYNPDNINAYKNQRVLDEKLAQIDLEYLRKVLKAQTEGTLEYEQARRELEKAERNEELRKRKQLETDLAAWLYIYSQKGAKERMDAELAVVDELVKQKKIKEKEAEEAKAAIRKKYRDEINSKTGTTAPNQDYDDTKDNYDKQLRALEDAHNQGLIEQEDYESRRWQITQNYHNKIVELVKGEGSDWGTMVGTLVETWKAGFEDLGSTIPEKLKTISAMAASAFAVMNAGVKSYTDYANASRDLELAKVEKNYKAQIDAAGNNDKKKKILEEQKEKEIAKIKTKYDKRAMVIEMAQAVASTAMAAINAYASAAQVPMIGYILAPIAASMALAAGALQIATIKKSHQTQQMGYYEGGFTSRDPNNRREAGVVHANEFVANHNAVSNPQLLPVLRLIDQAQRNNTVGSLTREDVSRAIGQGAILGDMTVAQQRTAEQHDTSMVMVATSMERQTDAINELNERLADGIESFMVMDGERGFDRSWERYQRMKNNPKR